MPTVPASDEWLEKSMLQIERLLHLLLLEVRTANQRLERLDRLVMLAETTNGHPRDRL